MNKKFLHLLSLLFGLLLGGSSLFAQFSSKAIPTQTGVFHAEFSAAASATPIDGLIGFGPVAAAGYGDMNILIRFNAEGKIDARNGGGYGADNELIYAPNKLYYFEVDADVAAKTYSVTVTSPGDEPVVIATDYAFRDNNYTGEINFISYVQTNTMAGEYMGISHFQMGSFNGSDFNQEIGTITGDFGFKLSAVPTSNNINTVLGFGGKEIAGYSDFNIIVRFNDQGAIDVRNGGGYKAAAEVKYSAGDEFGFYIFGNVESATYSVVAIDTEGTETLIADNYAFRDNNLLGSLTHFAIKRGNGPIGVKGLMIGTSFDDGDFKVHNVPVAALTDNFEIEYSLTPSKDNMDGVFALGPVAGAGWGDFNILIRFNANGQIDVRNGGGYEALQEIVYQGGKSYNVRIVGDAAARTYSVFVRDEAYAEEVQLAADYAFRDNIQGELAFASTKENLGYVTFDAIGWPMPLLEARPNAAPTVVAGADSLSLVIEDGAVSVLFAGITDGDVGDQTLSFSVANSDESIATATLGEFEADNQSISMEITPLSAGQSILTLTIMDNGGTENGGIDATSVDLVVDVMNRGRFQTIEVSVNEGQLGADARMLMGEDDLLNNFNWLVTNAGQGTFANDHGPAWGGVTGIPRFLYLYYMRFDLIDLPFEGEIRDVRLVVEGEEKAADSKFQEDYFLFAVPDQYIGGDDNRGQLQELGELEWEEGSDGGFFKITDVNGQIIDGKEKYICPDNAPGLNEMDDISTATEDWNPIRNDVLLPMGTFSLPLGSGTLNMSSEAMLNLLNEDLNASVTFVLGIERSTGGDENGFNGWPVYSGEDLGREPKLVVDWDFMTTSTQDLQNAAGIKVFPNPVQDYLQFSDAADIGKVRISSTNGQVLQQVYLSTNSLPVGQLTSGLYFVEIFNKAGVKIQVNKFFKER
ncbi:MAG: T9SS type A sorting domain-containing protein [Bacteroidota bacterium]